MKQESLNLEDKTQTHYTKDNSEMDVLERNTYQLDYRIINFCREYFLNGGDKIEAYIKAFNYKKRENITEQRYRKQISTNVSRLFKDPIIQKKMTEIQRGLGDCFNYKMENQFLELDEIKRKAS